LLRDEAALAVFERECIGTIDRIVAHMRLPDAHVDELKQAVRTKLLVAEGDRPAKISDYKGKGPLRSWVGVVATRQALSRLRRKHEDSPGDSALLGIESPHSGPELGFLKLHYREQFVRAFKAALAELDAGSRNSLRHHYVHGLTIDELAALYRIHRSNAARRVAKARDALLSGTRRRLVRELGIDRSEFESIMRLIESRLEVSIAGVLGDDR
jgi:RNA polymerase sigma-70 factor (ECF subfamily)